MSKDFFEAVRLLEEEKGIPADYLYEKISEAIVKGVNQDFGKKNVVVCEIDPEKQKIKVFARKMVVETVEDPDTEISLEQAQLIRKSAKVGKTIDIALKPKHFGRHLMN